MRLSLLQLLRGVRASYWFVPSVMVVLAIALGVTTIWLDSGLAEGLFSGLAWYQQSKPEGARTVLLAIAGSMITVAGVVFSITIVAISFAASQYGPRILTNFMGDRGNQVTLGTFIATFVYSVIVLRTIQAGDTAFVPQLSVAIAILLALCSIIVLIYFIHHTPESIHVNTVVTRIGRQLIALIEKQFPACFGEPPERSEKDEASFARTAEALFGTGGKTVEIDAASAGYIQAIDEDHMLSVAREHDLVVSVQLSPGQFVYPGRNLALAAPAGRVDEHIEKSLRHSWAVGSSRTPDQDMLFLIDELVEIAARALSTGVNDPYTAMTCMDWLAAAATAMAARREPSSYRIGPDGELRVIAATVSFAMHAERGFGRLRPYAAHDVNAAAHMLSCLGSLAEQCRSSEQAEALADQVDALFELARPQHESASLDRLKEEAAAARAAFAERRSRSSGHSAAPAKGGSARSHRQAAPRR